MTWAGITFISPKGLPLCDHYATSYPYKNPYVRMNDTSVPAEWKRMCGVRATFFYKLRIDGELFLTARCVDHNEVSIDTTRISKREFRKLSLVRSIMEE